MFRRWVHIVIGSLHTRDTAIIMNTFLSIGVTYIICLILHFMGILDAHNDIGRVSWSYAFVMNCEF